MLPGAGPSRAWFLPEQEQLVKDTIAANHGVALTATVPLCATGSPRVDSPAIGRAQVARGAASSTGSGDVAGDELDVLYASVALVDEQPALFGTAAAKDGWAALMAAVVRDPVARTVTIPAQHVRNPVYVCDPAPLQLSY